MGMTAAEYQRAGLALLPNGPAWNKSPDSTLNALMLALADGLARIDFDAEALLAEMFPAQAFILLDEWEAFAGLPECADADIDATITERRHALIAKLRAAGSTSLQFYIKLAADKGYKIQIEEHYPHHCLRGCTYPLHPQINWYRVFISIKATFMYYATVLDNVKTRLKVYDTGDIACLLDRYKPAHIEFIYSYEDDE